jgi:hypothetical protein
MKTVTAKRAKTRRYRALTVPFELPREQDLLDGVLADMRRGRIDHVLVRARSGVAVWRR